MTRTWCYRLTPEALIEEIDGRFRVYGRWDWQFGCWDVDFAAGRWREVTIDWPVLDRRGVWLEPEAVRGPDGHPAHANWRFEARAAFAAYFTLIPAGLRRQVAREESDQWGRLINAGQSNRREKERQEEQ